MNRTELEHQLFEEEKILIQQEKNRCDLRNATILNQARRKQRSEDTRLKIIIGAYFLKLLEKDLDFLKINRASLLLEYKDRQDNHRLIQDFLNSLK